MKRAAALIASFCLLFTENVIAQTSNGQVGGVVQDSSQALIPGVSVTLRNVDTGITTVQITNESGAYSFASVPPGTYQVTGALPGFKTSITNGVLVGTAAQVRLNLTLEVGQIDSRVEVTVSSAQIMTESSASVGDVLPAQRALNLPLVGNDVLDLVKIMPGYRSFPQFNAAGVAVYDVFAGQTSDTVNITRDGLTVNDGRNNAAVFGLTTTTNINPELVGEIRLILAPVDAELGRGNTQIQVQTKGGTNRYTGTAVWNVQNSAFNANTWDNNNDIVNGVWTPTRSDWRNTHDVTVTYGGPIVRNKTFFFASVEKQASRTRSLQTPVVYTDSARQGIFRYWENWNPSNAAAPVPVLPLTGNSATQGVLASVDYSGNPLAPNSNPNGTPYNGVLRCFSVFGTVKADGSPFSQNDCAGGTAVLPSGGTPWDSFRTTMDTTGHIAKILDKMPRANWFGSGDGLNTAGFRWVRPARGQGGGNAVAGVSDFVERTQLNLKIDQNFTSKHRLSGNWTYERDYSEDFLASWPDGLNGETRRRPQVLNITGTSTLSSSMLNEARFGLRRAVTGRFIPLESSIGSIQDEANQWYLSGGAAANGTPYSVAFNPAGVGNGVLSITSQNTGDTTTLYNFADTFSWTRSRHAFKFGVDIRLNRSNGFNSTGGSVIPTVTGGASTGLTSALNSTGSSGIFGPTQLNGFLSSASTGTAARAAAANLLYFMNASIANASQLYWIDDVTDVTSGVWEDLSTRQRKYRNQIENEWSVFWKDDWKFTKSLTLNLGLRYDYYSSPYIDSGFTSAPVGLGAGLFGSSRSTTAGLFDRWLTPGGTFLTGYGSNVSAANALQCIPGATQSPLLPVSTCDPNLLTQIEFVGPNTPNPRKVVIPQDRNNFGPAVGFAWQLPWFGEGQTTIRGGYQITYSAPRTAGSLDAILGSAPGNTLAPTTQVTDPEFAAILAGRALNLTDVPKLVPVRPTSAPGATVPIYGRSITSFEAYDPKYRTPYIQNITLQVTRSLPKNMTLDVRYVGTFGRKLDGTANLNLVTVFDNKELFDALELTRAGGESPLFDQMFAGLDIHGTAGTGYAAVGTCGTVAGAPGGEGCPAGQVRQHGSAHLRRNATFTTNLANGNYVGVINSLASLSTVQSGLVALPAGLTGVSSRVLRNGCDRLANGLYNPTNPESSTNIPTRCFPEDYFYTNPQFQTATYRGNLAHNNYHSLQIQHTIRPNALGISLQTTYTWSKLLTDKYNTFVDPRRRQADYSLDYAGVPQEIRMNGTFELPIGPNKLLFPNSSGWVARLLERWQTSIVYNWGSGQPRDTFTGQKLYAGGGGNQPQARPDIVGPWVNPKTAFQQNGPNNDTGTIYGSPSPYATFDDPQCFNRVGGTDAMGFNLQDQCTLNALALIAPANTPGAISLAPATDGTPRWGVPVLQNSLPGTQGTQGARMLRLPGRWFFDANISKSFRLTESKTLQLRIDANNILNHPNPGEPNFNVQSDDFGRVTADKVSNAASPRTFQAQLRLAF